MVPLKSLAPAWLAAVVLLSACTADTPPVEVNAPPTPAPTAEPTTSQEPQTEPTPEPPAEDANPDVPAAALTPVVDPDTDSAIAWSECDPGFECGTLSVPLDHALPSGDTIELDVIRRPAADPGSRLGTIVINPGGPGGSGVEFVRAGVPLDQSLQENFDIVGWDPRGVGDTVPECGQSLPAFYAADSAPTTPEAEEHLTSLAGDVAAECAAADSDGSDLASIGTTATVHDLELLRIALDEPLNYVGFSYGTQIGLLYAEAYGSQVRSMALVGVVDPALDFEDVLAGQTAELDGAVTRMFESCSAATGCDLADPDGTYDLVEERVRAGEFAAAGLGPAQLVDATVGAVYSESRWTGYLDALEAVAAGDPAPMLAQAEAYYGSGDLFLPYTAISCLQQEPPTDDRYADFSAELATLSPRFGADVANELLPCAYWPVAYVDETIEVSAANAPTILLVASTGDVVTPIEWTEAVSARLADSALIIRSGEGHTGTAAGACVAEGIALYLLSPSDADDLLECDD